MTKRRISIVSSTDAGCPLNEDEHLRYCEEVAEAVLFTYPDCDVDCEPGNVMTTTVSVYNFPVRDEDSVVQDCRYIAQNVWENGNFWD